MSKICVVTIVKSLGSGSHSEEPKKITIDCSGEKIKLDAFLKAVAESEKTKIENTCLVDVYSMQSDPYVLCRPVLPDANGELDINLLLKSDIYRECAVCINKDDLKKSFPYVTVYDLEYFNQKHTSTGKLAAKSLGKMLQADAVVASSYNRDLAVDCSANESQKSRSRIA